MSSVILYSYFRSSSAFRVRIALNHKKIAYETRPVHLIKDGGQHRKEEYKKLNPMGAVPCLVHDGNPISESMAIIEYLDVVFGGPKLFPSVALDAAKVRQICETVNSGIQPIQNLKVLQKLQSEFSASEETKNRWAGFWIQDGFIVLEKILLNSASQYSFSNNVTAADCYIVPQVFNAKRFNVNMSQFPIIQKIYDNCMKLDAFIKASPENQPDFERR